MKLNKPKNENYAAVVVEIKTLVPLENCDNVQAAIIMGNQVIVGKDVNIGDIGLYFPLECELSKEYLSSNNIYRKPELNKDPLKKGYFEENGRIRCVKFRGHKSEGLFMPLSSLNSLPSPYGEDNSILNSLKVGDEFDEIDGISVCKKYIIKQQRMPGMPGQRSSRVNKTQISKIIETQFRFHEDTSMLYKNLHRIKSTDLIHISYKLHGTSGISSFVLCRKQLKWYEKLLRALGTTIQEVDYDYLYSSRKVVKNPEINPNANHYYGEDIWGIADKELRSFLQEGMTFYYEVVGYLPNGSPIQKDYDYGCEIGQHKIYIYRITYTSPYGKVFEFSAKQVQEFCTKNGLNAVPELFYGFAKDFSDERLKRDAWEAKFLENIKNAFNEKDCFMSKNIVPEEGCVIRLERNEFEAYKCKSNRFYERETKLLDKGESNLEDEN